MAPSWPGRQVRGLHIVLVVHDLYIGELFIGQRLFGNPKGVESPVLEHRTKVCPSPDPIMVFLPMAHCMTIEHITVPHPLAKANP